MTKAESRIWTGNDRYFPVTSLIFRVLREDVTPSSQSSFGFIRRHYSGEDTEDSGVCFPTSRRSTTGTTAENLNGLGDSDSRNLNFKFELESLFPRIMFQLRHHLNSIGTLSLLGLKHPPSSLCKQLCLYFNVLRKNMVFWSLSHKVLELDAVRRPTSTLNPDIKF